MKPIVESTFQPKSKTQWGYDTICRFIRYGTKIGAERGAKKLRKQGWFVDSAYPTQYSSIEWHVVAVKRIYHYLVRFEILPVCENCVSYLAQCRFNHNLNRDVMPNDPADLCFCGDRQQQCLETRMNAFDNDEAIRKAFPRFLESFGHNRPHFSVKAIIES